MKATIALAATALSMGMIACGGSRDGTSASSVQTVRGTTTVATPAISRQRYLAGDYDSDDQNAGAGNDADNDDNVKPTDQDKDFDGNATGYYDSDDSGIRAFGHAANVTEQKAVVEMVERYYAAAAAADGAAACPMIVASLARAIPHDIGSPPGPPYARGKTCAVVMSKVFRENHRQLAAEAATLKVSGVRVEHGLVRALLSFTSLPGRWLSIAREGGAWKVHELLDRELP